MADISGSDGNDNLAGSGQGDSIAALAGADKVNGGRGGDTIAGGEGQDTLIGAAGDDVIFGYGDSDVDAGSGDITLDLVVSGLTTPLFASSAPGDPNRLYIVSKDGVISLLDLATGTVSATPVLNIAGSILHASEQGLLGMAFHPDYQTNGKVYVNVTNSNGDIEVRCYTRSANNPDTLDPGTADVILTVPHPVNANHNGGWMAFGPDGYLYIATGDGGSGGDPSNNAQNKEVLLGKMLRIDVNGDDFAADAGRDYAIPDDNPFVNADGADEIWALGLRNPWRNAFDSLTGDLYIADVGQGRREEVNFQDHDFAGGANYGWKVREGSLIFNGSIPGNPPPNSPELIAPVTEYAHGPAPDGGESITGGYVYRGPGPGMQGDYFYADFITNQVWSLKVVNGQAVDVINRTAQLVSAGDGPAGISSFAEDGSGRLYAICLDGRIFRMTPQAGAGDGGDVIRGGQGNDTAFGGAGNDLIAGGIGEDSLNGGSQSDFLRGNDGNDSLSGDGGTDRLRGGAGVDEISGGAGKDLFMFWLGDQSDTVTDFTDNVDTIRLGKDLGVATAGEALALAVEDGGNVIFTFAGGDVLTVLGTTKAALLDDLAV